MAALNQELDWATVGSTVTDPATGGTVADAFQLMFGQPTKDLVPAGMKIYKFNDFPSPARSKAATEPLSPWWSPSQPYKHDGGLVQKLKIAEANGVSAREWGRLTSVIREDWNSLAYIFELSLKVPVYGWFGGFKGMRRSGTGTSKRDRIIEKAGAARGLPGGGTQFYIPNLTLGMVSSFAIKPTENW